MVGARSPMSSAAVSKAHSTTKSCWCLEALARASQTGGAFRVSDLDKVQQVRQVGAKVLRCALVIFFLTDTLVV